jgi:hypothetical protein
VVSFTLGRFTPRERARSTHWTGGWVGSRAVLNADVVRQNVLFLKSIKLKYMSPYNINIFMRF